jgi:hypothetical protein
MRNWLCLSLSFASFAAFAALGCEGGREPVRTISGDGEYAGPGAADPYNDANGNLPPSASTLLALCVEACAHVRAEDCDGAPAHTVDECEFTCQSDLAKLAAWCAEEKAALYACTADAKITCSLDFAGGPIVEDCKSEATDFQECLSPGSDCVASPQNDEICFQMGFSTFLICSEGISPPPQCIQITSSAFCCP